MLFGINPAGAPWVANRHSEIRVKRNGDVRIKVRGLVIPGRVPPLLPNPLATLVAAVVCNGDGVGAVKTDAVPFSANGNANIRQKLKLPKPCLAPAVLFLTPAGTYIGASARSRYSGARGSWACPSQGAATGRPMELSR